MREIAEQLLAWRAAGERVAIATVMTVGGSAPRPAGSALIAAAGDRIAGSVSNGCVESDVYEAAMASLESGRARLVHYGISDEMAFTVGLSCGGSIGVLVEPVGAVHERAAEGVRAGRPVLLARVMAPEGRVGTIGVWAGAGPEAAREGWERTLAYLDPTARESLRDGKSRMGMVPPDDQETVVVLEPILAPDVLSIVGATDIAIALARFAKSLGYRVVVADPRAALATRERFPDVDEIVHRWPDEALGAIALGEGSAVVVLSHDEKFDHPALLTALRSPAGYVGAIGSRRTNELRFAWLRSQGLSDDDLARVHAPIGLDIGAKTAEETALAILAEIVAARRGRPGGSLRAQAAELARSR